MIRVLFICHGNICRSPMAEFVLWDMITKEHLEKEFEVASAATSTEEIGNGIHPGTRRKMAEVGIPVRPHRAVQMTRQDYKKYDYILGMDQWNLRNMNRILGGDPEGKVHLLLDYTEQPRDIADPWYTGNFDATYADISEGCRAFLEYVKKKKKLVPRS
ncbi:MAG TPA: low molecular weight phosphotyrosine protein phosphatase [Candidatus Blautia gallistercoris]|uniref:protein-tyrosine-phosphatase n=1 Tax=Candidatus Blautia gallistercoris TaxID=2838490 RepID=A0A9D1WIF6_9FIRM|nr:low molecular weight phosphotyrosine protein phosphatase [Candidatus Blautia gallistercoris]